MSGRPRNPETVDKAGERRLAELQEQIIAGEVALRARNELLFRMAYGNGYTQQALVNIINATNVTCGVRPYSVDAVGITLKRMRDAQ